MFSSPGQRRAAKVPAAAEDRAAAEGVCGRFYLRGDQRWQQGFSAANAIVRRRSRNTGKNQVRPYIDLCSSLRVCPNECIRAKALVAVVKEIMVNCQGVDNVTGYALFTTGVYRLYLSKSLLLKMVLKLCVYMSFSRFSPTVFFWKIKL